LIKFSIDKFITSSITGRENSYFELDLQNKNSLLLNAIKGKKILVIGGGGTIGSNYIKSILRFKPFKVVIIDINENGLTELVRDIRSTKGLVVPDEFITYPVNLGDHVFEKLYTFHKPFDTIANFAAHKHVRSEKDIFSVEAMVQNNVFYAYRLLQLIEKDKPEHFFCVSTDKAANPVNIMGASKKLMEEIVMEYSNILPCTTARFANVAFSNGSLLDGFIQRLMKRQPLSVPADVKRYFVSPQESGHICMLSCMLGKTGDIYFPKLQKNQLISFLDITERFLHANGFSLDKCSSEEEAKGKAELLSQRNNSYPVYVFESDTTGEKLYEEFYTDNEVVDWNSFEALGVIKKSKGDRCNVQKAIDELKTVFNSDNNQKKLVVHILSKYLSNFDHIEKSKGLDSKM